MTDRPAADFAQRVYDLCEGHITGRAETESHACGDCPVWTLRAEAAKILRDEATA